MTITCRDRLEGIISKGTKKDRVLAEILLEDGFKFKTIQDLSKKSGISSSSIHRFAGRMGYSTFKNFTLDYNSTDNENFVLEYSNNRNINAANIAMGTDISKRVKGSIHIVPSRRTQGIAMIMSDQLKTIYVKHRVYNEEKYNLKEFVESVPSTDTLILISLTGHSGVISDAITHIARSKGKKPRVIILTSSKPLKIFSKYEFMDVAVLEGNYNLSNWRGHFEAVIDTIKVGLIILQKKYKKFE